MSKLPGGLHQILTARERKYIARELSKSKESDQLGKLAEAMEEF